MANENSDKIISAEQSLLAYNGPLPPAEEYGRYEQSYPGTAERILTIAEIEAEHRRALEKEEQRISCKYHSRGQFFAFTIGLASLGAAVTCAFLNQAVVAVVPAVLGCVSLAAVFLGKRG